MGGFVLLVEAPYFVYTIKMRLAIAYGVFGFGLLNHIPRHIRNKESNGPDRLPTTRPQ